MSASVRAARDPFVDLLRTGAILVVVFGHWLMPVLARHGSTVSAGNALATPGWWLLTWPAQVMPVFFVAGGAANFHSYQGFLARGGTTQRWLAARVRRLVLPVFPLLAVWLAVPDLLLSLGVPAQPVGLAAAIVGQLLWFLAVYLIAMALVPVMLAARNRWGDWVFVVLTGAAVGVDVLRLHGVPLVGYTNEVFVWLAVQQLGIEYAAGRFSRLTRKGALALGFAGLGGTALLVLLAGYPDSMVGLPGQTVSNMSPATICLLTLGLGQFGFLLAARERLVVWSRRPGPAAVLRAVGSRCLTVYLWHMSALVLVAGVAVVGFGYATPQPGSPGWLVALPVSMLVMAVVLRVLVAVLGRFEAIRPAVVGAVPVWRMVVAVVVLVAGLTGIAAAGFVPAAGGWQVGPIPWIVLIGLGFALTVPRLTRRAAGLGTRVLGALVTALPRN
jgi:hypothetical protein